MFRADADLVPEIGTGHLVRCVTLARAILKRHRTVRIVFLTRLSLPAQTLLAEFRDNAVFIPVEVSTSGEGLISALDELRAQPNSTTVVFDTLGVHPSTVATLRTRGFRLVTLDDTGPGAELCDVSINPILRNPTADYSGYRYLVLPHGPFRSRHRVGIMAQLFLSFGGHDEHGILVSALGAIISIADGRGWTIEAFAGHTESAFAQASSVATKFSDRVRIHRYTPDHFDRLARSDLAIVSGGLTLFSALHAGVPAIVIAQYEHQLATGRDCEAEGAALSLGMWSEIDARRLAVTVTELADDRERRQRMSRRGRELVDGLGTARVTEIILKRASSTSGAEK